MTIKLFVYGTLMSGFHNHRIIEGNKKISDAFAPGCKLIDLGSIPGMILDDEGTTLGELWEINGDVLARCDRLEGYDPTNPDQSLYRRCLIAVTCLNEERTSHAAFTYIWNGRNTNNYIKDGDFRGKYGNASK